METIDADVDLSEYYEEIDRAQLRQVKDYTDQLLHAFAPASDLANPSMFSTKLRNVLEFRPGEITCWAGYNGHRKSMFTGQVALDLVAQKKRCLMVSLEMQPVRTLERMARQAFGTDRPSPAQLRSFGDWTGQFLWLFDHLGRLSPAKMTALCRMFHDRLHGAHVFIDSMMMVCASEESMDEQKQFVTDLVRIAQETWLHIHLVTHCRKPQNGENNPPSKYDLRGSAAISDQAHNIVTVWSNREKKRKLEEGDTSALVQPDALVTVEKQRNGRWEGKVKLAFDDASLRFRDDEYSPIVPYRGLQ